MNKIVEQDLVALCEFYNVTYNDSHPSAQYIMPKEAEYASVLLNLMDVPDRADGLLFMKPVMDYLLNHFKVRSKHKCSKKTKFLYEIFWIQLEDAASKGVLTLKSVSKQKSRGFRGTNPIYAFLFFSCIEGEAGFLKVNQSMCVSFLGFGSYFFGKMNAYAQSFTSGTMENLCLVGRKLIYAEPNIKVKRFKDPSREQMYELAIKAFPYMGDFNNSTFEESNKTYVMDLLFRDSRKVKDRSTGEHTYQGMRERWSEYDTSQVLTTIVELEDEAFYTGCFYPTGRKQVKMHDIPNFAFHGVNKDDIKQAGESSVDYFEREVLEVPADFFTDPWRAKQLRNQRVEATIFSTRRLPWEKSVISKSNLSLLINKMLISKGNPILGIISLALFMGMTEKVIRKLYVGEISPENNQELDDKVAESLLSGYNIDKKRMSIWYYSGASNRDEKNYFNLDCVTEFRLPKIISDVLVINDNEYLFSADDFRSAKGGLKKLGIDGTKHISIGRLVDTFSAYFVCSYGLPELYADKLSGTSKKYLASQHFYVTQNHGYLNQQWHKFVGDFVNEYSPDKLLLLPDAPTTTFSQTRYPMSEKDIFIGASNTPTKSALRKHFAWLRKQFPKNVEDLVRGNEYIWNAYLAYLYGMFSVCTGQRPLRDPIPDINELCQGYQVLHITDKNSYYHREERCVLLCKTLMDSLKSHTMILKQWRYEQLYKNRTLSPNPLIFPVIVDVEEPAISAKTQVLDKIFTSSESGYMKSIKNGFRHYVLTTLYQSGLQQSDIDWLSGHKKMGMEVEFYSSPSSWVDIASRVNCAIENHIVKDLGLETPFNE